MSHGPYNPGYPYTNARQSREKDNDSDEAYIEHLEKHFAAFKKLPWSGNAAWDSNHPTCLRKMYGPHYDPDRGPPHRVRLRSVLRASYPERVRSPNDDAVKRKAAYTSMDEQIVKKKDEEGVQLPQEFLRRPEQQFPVLDARCATGAKDVGDRFHLRQATGGNEFDFGPDMHRAERSPQSHRVARLDPLPHLQNEHPQSPKDVKAPTTELSLPEEELKSPIDSMRDSFDTVIDDLRKDFHAKLSGLEGGQEWRKWKFEQKKLEWENRRLRFRIESLEA